jgi:hypothetical protein
MLDVVVRYTGVDGTVVKGIHCQDCFKQRTASYYVVTALSLVLWQGVTVVH